MNATIRKEIKKHVSKRKPILEGSLIVREIKKEIKKHQLKHVIK